MCVSQNTGRLTQKDLASCDDGICVAQAAAEASADAVSVLSRCAFGAYIGIGSGDYDALCREHGMLTGAICRPLMG
jgi:hypothetical protein